MTNLPRSRRSSASLALAVLLGGERYGIPFEYVDEVLPTLPVESLPECPAYVRGVMLVRDQLIPVIDAALRLNLRSRRTPLEPHIVCLRVDGHSLGLQVDEALELIEIATNAGLSLAEIATPKPFCCGIYDLNGEVIRMLDPAQLLPDRNSSLDADVVPDRRGDAHQEHSP